MAAVAACGSQEAPAVAETSSAPAAPVPAVMFAGCSEVGPRLCVRDGAAPLVVWLDIQRHAELRVAVDGEVVHPESSPVDGGLRLVIEADAEASRLEIDGLQPTWTSAWVLELRPHQQPPEVAAAMKRLRGGEPDAAVEWLEAELPSLSPDDRLDALGWLAAAAWVTTGRISPEREHAVVELARELGQTHREAQSLATLIVAWLLPRGELLEAQARLERLDALAEHDDQAKVWAADRRARLADVAGDSAAALRGFEATTRHAARLGAVKTELEAWKALSALHMRVSRWPEVDVALARIERLADDPSIDCRNRMAALTAIGWRRLRQRAAGLDAPWPDPEFEAALALAEPGGRCPNPDAEDNLRINLALSNLHDGDPAGALLWLEPLDDVREDLEPWVREIRARGGMQLGRLEHVPSPLVVIDDPNPDDQWNALVRQAEFLSTIGAHAAVLEAWSRAEALVEGGAAELDVSAGREHFVAGRRASAEGLVDALVKAGRTEEAMCRGRLARNRALRMLDLAAALDRSDAKARTAWMAQRARFVALRRQLREAAVEDRKFSRAQRERRRARRLEARADANAALDAAARALRRERVESCEALAPVAQGAVRLLVFPVRGSWLVFADDGERVEVVRLDALPHDPSEPSLEQLAGLVGSAQRLQVLLTGAAWSESIAAWRFGSGVLLDRGPVEYALDLVPRPPTPLGARAVVVADPSQDLALARDEAQGATSRLTAAGWEVEHLVGEAASLQALTDALAETDVLHYAGHGESRGDAGWQAALLLADDARLEVKDILALRSVPSRAVLTGCETGSPDAATLEGGMSLGRAFVLAGSDAVLVADGKVADDLARDVGEQVYADVAPGTWDMAASLRHAQLEQREAGVDGWAQFRVVVP